MTNTQTRSRTLHTGLWVAQVVLAGIFMMAGYTKATQPIDQLAAMLPWTIAVPHELVRFIGVSEILAAIGLLLPALLRIKPILTPLAASGLVTVMVLAAGFHATRGEGAGIGLNLTFAAIALFIAWGRFKKAPIQEKESTIVAG